MTTTVAILGAGPVGRWLAREAAQAGYRVLLEDVMPATLRQARQYLDESPQSVELVSTIEDSVRQADLAIDCVPDELESKLEIFCLLDRMAPPKTVLCTPTVNLSIADLASCTYRPERCIAVVSEPAALPSRAGGPLLLRITAQTADDPLRLTQDFWERLGFKMSSELDRQA